MFCKVPVLKLLLIFGFVIVLIHVFVLAVILLMHVVQSFPGFRKAVMKRPSCCQSK